MRQKVCFDIKSLIIIVVCIIGVRAIIYEVPQCKPFIGKYAYDYAVRNITHEDIKQLKGNIQREEETSIYFLGRGSCSDCRQNIKNIKTLKLLATQKYNLDMTYIQLDDSIDEAQKSFLEELGVESIPTVLLVTKDGIKQLIYMT